MRARLGPMSSASSDPRALLRRCLESDRIHSAYLLSGPGVAARDAALEFVRALVCSEPAIGPCEECLDCRRSKETAFARWAISIWTVMLI